MVAVYEIKRCIIIPAQRDNLRKGEVEGTLSLFLRLIIWTHGDNGFGLCPYIANEKCSAGIITTQSVPAQKNIWQHSNRTSLYSVIYLPRQGRKGPLLSLFGKNLFGTKRDNAIFRFPRCLLSLCAGIAGGNEITCYPCPANYLARTGTVLPAHYP